MTRSSKPAPSPLLKGVHAILLDVDGTLVDSNDAHARAWVEAFEDAGFTADAAEIRTLIGKGGDKIIPQLTGLDPESPRAKALSEARGLLFLSKYLPTVRAFPQAAELVRSLADQGMRLVIATSAKADELEKILDMGGLSDLLPLRTTSSDVKDSKPDPDIVLAALEKVGVKAEAAVLIGDTPYDLAAAKRAGVKFIGLLCGGWGKTDLAGAIAVFADPADLLRHLSSDSS